MSIVAHKCPNCGGTLVFNAKVKNWKCEYCLDVFYNSGVKDSGENDISDDSNPALEALMEEAEQQEIEDFEADSKVRIFSCASCGAEVITDAATSVPFCYYCHSKDLSPGRLSGIHRPTKVIPFNITEDAAAETFTSWYKEKKFLSGDALSEAKSYKLTGIYIPFWRFDCKAIGKIAAGTANDRVWGNGNKTYKETDIYDVSRTATAQYRGITVNGSKKASDRLMETLGPYDYTRMEDFSIAHLSGYMAAKYDMDHDEVFGPISDGIHRHSRKLLEDTIYGYDHAAVKDCSIDIKKKNIDCILLPIWIFTYDYKGNKYMYAMNGQNGKPIGSLPISTGKVSAWFCMVSALLFIILWAVGGITSGI